MPPSFTVSSGSERVVVYPESASRSASVHSPTTSESRSFSSSNDSEGWTEVSPYHDDGIKPSDSASRSKQSSSSHSRRHTTEARPAPARRHSSRRVPTGREHTREELPRRQPSRRHRDESRERRHHRSHSRRTPSDESASVASVDEYPYGHHGGMPPPRNYPPSGYRHVPAPMPQHAHGGYPPSMSGAPAYSPDSFQQAQALVHMPLQTHTDPFGYPSSNPFSPGAGPQQNPFSPMAPPSTAGYFNPDPQQPPMQHMPQQRPQAAQRHSMYGPGGAGHPGGEMVASPYQHPGMYPPYGMPGYPQVPYMYPPSHPAPTASPPTVKEDPRDNEMKEMKEMMKKYQDDLVARELAIIAKAEAEEAAKKKAAEIAAASAVARAEAEQAAEASAKKVKEESDAKWKEAEEASKKAKEESEKKLADAKKAKEEIEAKKKELEDQIKKNAPLPDMLKPPIKFKDALGRTFSFPWHLCKTWKGMEGLIKQAFVHVDVIGDRVHQGRYDLTGPDAEIILPQVWDTMVQPSWEISMHMWPCEEDDKKQRKKDKLAQEAEAEMMMMQNGIDPFAGLAGLVGPLDDLRLNRKSSRKDANGKKASTAKTKKRASAIVDVPTPSSSHQGGAIPPPPNFPPGLEVLLGEMPYTGEAPRPKAGKPRSKSNKDVPFLTSWIAGSRKTRK